MELISKFKEWLRSHRNSGNPVIRFGIIGFDLCISIIRRIRLLATDRKASAIWYMERFQPGRTHQTTAMTWLDRYPDIFRACRDYFTDRDHIKILSFGCSTGEEVITLRHYFPNAEIVGAEINKNSLRVCKSLHLDDKVHFVNSRTKTIQKHGPYDAIFCMAVLQRTPHLIADSNTTDLSQIYPFEKFEKQIIELDSFLKESGLMIVHLSQYDLCDTAVYQRYVPYGDCNQDHYGPYVFGKDSKIKKTLGHRHSIFVKKAH